MYFSFLSQKHIFLYEGSLDSLACKYYNLYCFSKQPYNNHV